MLGVRLSKGITLNWGTSFKDPTPITPVMTAEEFRHLCAELKITDSQQAAELFGLSWRTCQRYWYGELQVPQPLARLVRLAAAQKLSHKAFKALGRTSTAPLIRY